MWLAAPDLESAPEAPVARVVTARGMLKRNRVEDAIGLLEAVENAIPEFVEAQTLLCGQLRRVGRTHDAIRCALYALGAPACCGHDAKQVRGWLARQTQAPDDCMADPLWRARSFDCNLEAVKVKADYDVSRAVIDHICS